MSEADLIEELSEADLIEALASHTGLQKAEAKRALRALQALAEGDSDLLSSFTNVMVVRQYEKVNHPDLPCPCQY